LQVITSEAMKLSTAVETSLFGKAVDTSSKNKVVYTYADLKRLSILNAAYF